VFRSARQLGFNSAAAGFYHPYSRVVGADLVKAFSISSHVLFEEPVYWENVHGLEKFYRLLQSPLHRVPIIVKRDLLGTWRRRQTFKVAFEQVRARAFEMALQPEIGLVFLHFPSPHPPGIYDRAKRQITADSHGTYVDNLALLDRTLGELRREMEAAGQWNDSFVLLSSDHPLREKPFHPWITFLLQAPGQKQGLAYHQPFNSVLTHDLVLAALSHQLKSPQDVADWLDRFHGRFPVMRKNSGSAEPASATATSN